MGDDIIKLAGEEHLEQEVVLLQPTEDCNSLAGKAIALGAPSEIADQFTTEGMHALRAKVAPETAVKFKMHFQTEALELLGVENAETALLFTDQIKSSALTKALKLGLSTQIALDVGTDALLSEFNVLAPNNPIVEALKLDVPLARAFAFDTDYKVQALKKIKETCENRDECIADALNIDSQTKLDALLADIDHKKATEFINMFQVKALYKLKDLNTRRELTVTQENAALWSLAIDTQTKWDALDKGVDPEHAKRFFNNYQVQAWYVLKTFVTDNESVLIDEALAIDTEIKLQALRAGVPPEQACKFTNPLQIQAWHPIHQQIADKKQSAEYTLEVTNPIQVEALKVGVYASDAIKFDSKLQLEAWLEIRDKPGINKLQTINDLKKLQNPHQLDALKEGADLKDALQVTKRSQVLAYSPKTYNLPFELAMKFTDQHQIDLLGIKIDPVQASETPWHKAQYLLLKSDPAKYFTGTFKSLQTDSSNKIKHLNENRDEIPGFVMRPIAAVASFVFGVWILKKVVSKCSHKPEYSVGSTTIRETVEGGVRRTTTIVTEEKLIPDTNLV
jgi:hypothetical protein